MKRTFCRIFWDAAQAFKIESGVGGASPITRLAFLADDVRTAISFVRFHFVWDVALEIPQQKVIKNKQIFFFRKKVHGLTFNGQDEFSSSVQISFSGVILG